MSDKEKQVKSGIAYIAQMAITQLITLLTLPIFTRILTKEDYGYFALAKVYAAFAVGLTNLGLNSALERNHFEYERQGKELSLLYSVTVFVLLVAGFWATVTFFLQGYISSFLIGSSEHGPLILAGFCAQALMMVKAYFFIYLRNCERANEYLFFGIIEISISVVIWFWLIVFERIGIIAIFYGQIASSLLVILIISLKIIKEKVVRLEGKLVADSLKLGSQLIPKTFVAVASAEVDKYLIGLMQSIGGVGIFSLGQRIARVPQVLIDALGNVYQPQTYRHMFSDDAEKGKVLANYLLPFFYLSMLIAFGGAIFAFEAVTVLMPESYHEAIYVVMVLAMVSGVVFFAKIPTFLYVRKAYLSTVVSTMSFVVGVGLNILFIKQWGIMGAAWAVFTTGMLTALVTFILYQKNFRIHWNFKTITILYLIFFVSILTVFLGHYFAFAYLLVLALKLFCLALILVVGNRLGLFTREIFSVFSKVIARR